MAAVIHRAQFTRLCLTLAAEAAADAQDPQSYAGAGEALYWTMRSQGIDNPRSTLNRISAYAHELELAHPEMTELARQEMAVLAVAGSPFVARINGWFDQTMDRVAARFTSAVRVVTLSAALGLALFLQIDCLALVNRLAAEDRGKQAELIHVPSGWAEWLREWSGPGGGAAHGAGILLTALLLSLGAPFWYNVLAGAIRLRPVLSEKDDRERESRATSWPAFSAPLRDTDEWPPSQSSRYSAGRR